MVLVLVFGGGEVLLDVPDALVLEVGALFKVEADVAVGGEGDEGVSCRVREGDFQGLLEVVLGEDGKDAEGLRFR